MQERARREKHSAGKVLSELVRQALVGRRPHPGESAIERHGFRPPPHRGAAVSNALIDQLRDDEPG